MNVTQLIAGILIWATFLATLFTMGAYQVFADWRSTVTGKRFMLMLALKALLLGLILARRMFGAFPFYDEAALVVFGFWAVSIAGMGTNIIRAQIKGRTVK